MAWKLEKGVIMLNVIKKIGKVALIGLGIAGIYEIGRSCGIDDSLRAFSTSDDDTHLLVHHIGPIYIWADRNNPNVTQIAVDYNK